MVAPLNFAKHDNLAVSNMAGKLENLDWLLFIGQMIHVSVEEIEEKPIKILEFASRATRTKVIKFCKVQWSHHTE